MWNDVYKRYKRTTIKQGNIEGGQVAENNLKRNDNIQKMQTPYTWVI